jgi:hypothetical protein
MMIYDPARIFGKRLETIAQPYLKIWAGLAESANATMLYLPKEQKGLGLKNLAVVFTQLQVSKMHILKHSQDVKIQQLYSNLHDKGAHKKRWNAPTELEHLERTVALNKLSEGGQTNTAGLGSRKKKSTGNPIKDDRKEVLQASKEKELKEKMTHLYSLAVQGQWLQWDHHMKNDRSWSTLLYHIPQELFEWANNVQLRTLPTPNNLKRWNRKTTGKCALCHASNITLHHILNYCSFSLKHKRYTWRHDGILRSFTALLSNNINKLYNPDAPQGITFVKAGARGKTAKSPQTGILCHSDDWKMCADISNMQYTFPAHIAQTSSRPDILIWSEKIKTILLLELTVPLEENTALAQARKLKRYQDLVEACKMNGYQAHTFTLEVGSRGWIAPSVSACMHRLGIPPPQVETLLHQLSNNALRMSYLIYVNRENPLWKPWEWEIALDPPSQEVCDGDPKPST